MIRVFRFAGLIIAISALALCIGCEDDPTSVKLVKESQLVPALGARPVQARIYSIIDPSTSFFDPDEFQTTRVEIATVPPQEFRLPESMMFAAETAEIKDLDGDGIDEVLLVLGAKVAIVSMISGKATFRPSIDTLKSSWGDVDIVTSKNAGMVLLTWKPFPTPEATDPVPIPEAFRWSVDKGFVNVTSQARAFVDQELIPAYRARIDSAPKEKRPTFELALRRLKEQAGIK